jgi:hypothetical protein
MKNLTFIATLVASSCAFAGETTVQENDIGAYVPHCAAQVASVSVGKPLAAELALTLTIHIMPARLRMLA